MGWGSVTKLNKVNNFSDIQGAQARIRWVKYSEQTEERRIQRWILSQRCFEGVGLDICSQSLWIYKFGLHSKHAFVCKPSPKQEKFILEAGFRSLYPGWNQASSRLQLFSWGSFSLWDSDTTARLWIGRRHSAEKSQIGSISGWN